LGREKSNWGAGRYRLLPDGNVTEPALGKRQRELTEGRNSNVEQQDNHRSLNGTVFAYEMIKPAPPGNG
jgi:hypothetical protein